MILDWELHKIAQTAHIWFTTPNWWRDATPSQMFSQMSQIFYFVSGSLNMYAQTGNFLSAKYIICCGICAELPTKGGVFSDTPKGSKSCMVNPLPAMMEFFPGMANLTIHVLLLFPYQESSQSTIGY